MYTKELPFSTSNVSHAGSFFTNGEKKKKGKISDVFDTSVPHSGLVVHDVTDTDCMLGTKWPAALTVVFSRLSNVD